jgi:single-strand DNA-binding protein
MSHSRDDLNEVFVSGRLTRNPDFRSVPGGGNVLDFYIACNRYLRKGEELDTRFEQLTTFIKCTAWGKRAEKLKELLHTGDEILVKGQLVDDNFSHDGQQTSGRLKLDNLTMVKILKTSDR